MCVGGGEGQRSEEDEDVGGENYKRRMSLCVGGGGGEGQRSEEDEDVGGENYKRRMSLCVCGGGRGTAE